ncbi:MAG: RibD family protein [Pseudomonadota bacterium]
MNLNQRIEQWLIETRNNFHTGTSGASSSRPFVTLCFAQSLDGSLTTRPGETLRLSGAESTQLTHQMRSLHDGILVGIGTVLADDPQLTVREWQGQNPQPIVLDSQLRMPANAKLCQSRDKRCWVLSAQQTNANLECDLLQIACNDAGHVDLPAALQLLKQKGIHNLMVEGGASVITAFLQAQLVDALVLTIAPKLIGGYRAVGALGFSATQQLPRLKTMHSDRIGDDMIVWGSLQFAGAGA